jgi:hypothetical protein
MLSALMFDTTLSGRIDFGPGATFRLKLPDP